MTPQPTTTIELDDERHQQLQRREWIAERGGMTLIALVIAAALLGFLGPGPLSHRIGTSSDGNLSVEYYSIQRYEAPATMVVRFRIPPPGTKLVKLGLSRAFTDRVSVENMTPEPESIAMEPNRIVYSFYASRLNGEGTVTIRYKHMECGSVQYAVEAENTKSEVSQFVLP